MKKALLFGGVLSATLLAVSCKQNNVDGGFDYYYYTPEEYALISQKLDLPETPPKYTADLAKHLTAGFLAPRPVNSDEATLGRVLFYDTELSKDKKVSCASCHNQEKGFADGKVVATGVEERAGTRNSIALSSVANFAAYYGNDLFGPGGGIPFMWDNRFGTVAEQIEGAMTNPKEMDMSMAQIVDAVKAQNYYAPLFRKAFGDDNVTADRVTRALGSFVNAMGSYTSPFDIEASKTVSGQFGSADYYSNFSGFSAAENRGKAIYMQSCGSCHSTNFGRPTTVASNNGLDDAFTADLGVGGVSGIPSEKGQFKVPTLRNIALSAPYMHDGRFNTLEEVVEHYSNGVKNHPNLGSELRSLGGNGFNFTTQEKQDLVAFLGTLTDETFRTDKRFADPFKQ
jgi:cytochrome c peroxidase